MGKPAITGLAVLCCSAAFAQEFEVVSVKLAPPQPEGHTSTRISVSIGSATEPGRLNYLNVSLKELIGEAYKVQQYQITAPDWVGRDRFDIAAVIPAGTPRDGLPRLLQALLTDRFRLILRRESKDLPLYALTVAKNGPKLKATESATGIDSNRTGRQNHVHAQVPLARFAEYLSLRLDRPVLDDTGLSGVFEITVDWTTDAEQPANDTIAGPSIFTALQEQLGLRLTTKKKPVEIYVVDHVERPAEN